MAKTEPGIEQGRLPFDNFLDRYQRIDTLMRVEGFMPVSQAEQVEAMGLGSFPSVQGGAAKHLAEVVLHQRKANTEDPMAAARRLTRDYISWAQDAQNSRGALHSLEADLRDDVNPHLILDRVIDGDDERVLPFLRFFDLSVLRQDGHINNIGYDPQKVDYKPDNPGIMFYVEEAVSQWRAGQIRNYLPAASAHEDARLGFWTARLGEVERHYPVLAPIAREGLANLRPIGS